MNSPAWKRCPASTAMAFAMGLAAALAAMPAHAHQLATAAGGTFTLSLDRNAFLP